MKHCLLVLLLSIACFGQGKDVTPPTPPHCPQKFDISTNVSGTALSIPNDCAGVLATFAEDIGGSPATMSAVLAGCMRGTAPCTTLETNTSTTSTQRKPNIDAAYDYFLITPTWTGGTNVTFTVHNTTSSSKTSGGASAVHGALVNNDCIKAFGTTQVQDAGSPCLATPIAESSVTNLVSDLALKAPLASPALSGAPTAPTPSANDNSTKLATTAYADAAVTNGANIVHNNTSNTYAPGSTTQTQNFGVGSIVSAFTLGFAACDLVGNVPVGNVWFEGCAFDGMRHMAWSDGEAVQQIPNVADSACVMGPGCNGTGQIVATNSPNIQGANINSYSATHGQYNLPTGDFFDLQAGSTTPYITWTPTAGHILCGYASDNTYQCSFNGDAFSQVMRRSTSVLAAQLPVPTSSTLGGVQAKGSVSHFFFNQLNTSGVLGAAQPDYSDLTGVPVLAGTLVNAAHKWLNAYNATTGVFTQTQPAYADISGTPTLAATLANASHKWFNSYDSSTGLFTQTQPDYSDLTGTPAAALPLTGGTETGAVTFNSNADKLGQGQIVADSAGINTTETVVVQSAALPANRLQAGTVIRATLYGACTDTVANTTTFRIRIGTAGTTSDTAVYTYTTSVSGTTGTSIPFSAILDTTIRTTGASATSFGNIQILSKVNTGIVVATAVVDASGAGTTFSTATANLIISVTVQTAASTTTHTMKQAFINILNL